MEGGVGGNLYSRYVIGKHVSYLGLPVYYGLKLNKLTVNIGFQASLVLFSSVRVKKAGSDSYPFDWANNYEELTLDRYDFGIRAGLIYSLTDKIAIEGTYYYGLNDITSNEYPEEWKNQQITIGIRYTVTKSPFGAGVPRS